MENKKVTIKDIARLIVQFPKIFTILRDVDKTRLNIMIFLNICSGFFPVITLLISQELLNSLVIPNRNLRYTLTLMITYVGVCTLFDIISNIQSYVQNMYQYKMQYGLQFMVMNRCSRLKLRDFEDAKNYDRIEKISGEISFRPYQTFSGIMSIISAVVSMFSSFCIILAWNSWMALLLIIIPCLSLYYYLKIGQQEFKMVWNRANEERKMWYLNHLLTHDFSYKEMKVLNIGSFLLDKYKNITQNFISDNKKILKKKTIFDIIYGTIIQIVSGIIIGVSTVAAIAGKILVGNVISIIRALSMVQSSSRQIMMNIYAIYSNSLYMDNLFSFIHDTDEASENEGTKELKEDIKDINLNNVSFSYDNKKNVVDNVSLHLEAGKRVAIVGPNGSGKSTLLKLITGLYEPVDGKICINGTPIPELKKEDYYKRISVLFQDYVKYEFTLRENIGVGDYDNINNDEKILKDLKTTKTDFLKDTNGKVDLNMQLGNWFKGGRNLSQGQWQKIALARAYFKDASCYILDEPNAALDTVSEREVFDKFFSISKDHIGIYISHRLNAAKMADEIIVMSNGKIVDIGTHDKLLDRCGVYQELYEAESYEQ